MSKKEYTHDFILTFQDFLNISEQSVAHYNALFLCKQFLSKDRFLLMLATAPLPCPPLPHMSFMGGLPTYWLRYSDTDNAQQRAMYVPSTAFSVPNRELASLPWCYQKGSFGVLVGQANSSSFSTLYHFPWNSETSSKDYHFIAFIISLEYLTVAQRVRWILFLKWSHSPSLQSAP